MASDLQRNLRRFARLLCLRRVDEKRRGLTEKRRAARRHCLTDRAQRRRIARRGCVLAGGVRRRAREFDRRDRRRDDVNVGLDDEGLEEDRKQRRKSQRRPFDGRSAPPTVASAPPEHWGVIL